MQCFSPSHDVFSMCHSEHVLMLRSVVAVAMTTATWSNHNIRHVCLNPHFLMSCLDLRGILVFDSFFHNIVFSVLKATFIFRFLFIFLDRKPIRNKHGLNLYSLNQQLQNHTLIFIIMEFHSINQHSVSDHW
jgi:hypothetical protein